MAEVIRPGRLFEAPRDEGAADGGVTSRRESGVLGAVSEQLAVVRLLELGHKVARPVVDDDGVDLVVNYRVTVQVKSSRLAEIRARKHLYRFHVFTNSTKRWYADVYLFHGTGDSGRERGLWWVVPGEALRAAGAKTSVSVDPDKATGWSGRLAPYLEAWDLFERLGST